MTVRVARARLEEVQPLAAEYRRDASLEGLQVDAPLPTGALFWRATDSDEAVGYAAGTLRPEGIILGPFYVRATHRRAGIGLALLTEIERWASGSRIPVVEVGVAADNTPGVKFLEAAGYRPRRLLMTKSNADSPGGTG